MEVKKGKDGRRLFSVTQKKEIVAEIDAGKSAEEISRLYGVPMQYLYRWRRLLKEGGERALKGNGGVVPVAEAKKLKEEIRQLHRALGKMTMERDILRDSVEIAREKKWI
jgi:transposase